MCLRIYLGLLALNKTIHGEANSPEIRLSPRQAEEGHGNGVAAGCIAV